MKLEMDEQRPEHWHEYWPGQYRFFSPLEYAAGIPQLLFAITTWKENGKGNINFHAWGAFQGDEGGYFAILPGLCRHTHTYSNICRTGEFCVNFLSRRYYDGLGQTIQHNAEADDEFAAGNFHIEPARVVAAPRILESFLTLECRTRSIADLSGCGVTAMVIGRVVNMAVDEDYAHGVDRKYTDDGFMFNLHAPVDWATGDGNQTGVATLELKQTY